MPTPLKSKWPFVRLGDVAEFRNGVNYSKANFGKGVRVIGVSDFQNNVKASFGELEEINPAGVVRKEHYLRDGDILFVRSNGNRDLIGRNMFVENPPEEVTHSAFSIRLRFVRRDCLPRFYAYVLRSPLFRQSLSLHGGGTNISNLNQDILGRLQVPFPPRPIQHQIASILSAYDDLIENNTRRIKILEQMAQMVYREWFVYFRYPGHAVSKMIDSSLGRIPNTWRVEPLEALCTRITDGSHWSPATVESGRPMASSKDMHPWGLTMSTCRAISDDDFDDLVRNDCKPLEGDVLITKDGANFLKFCFAVERDMDVVILSSIALLRPNPRLLSSLYLSLCLTDPAIKTRLSGRVSGVAIPRIVLKDFRSFGIAVPPISLQAEFDHIVGPIAQLCRKLTDKNTNLRGTRDFLLPKLVSGEVGVDQLETEPAAQIS
jgi:type I restriction enzyme S subunit